MSLHLHHLSLINFKNYDEVSVNFDKRVQCFLGNNGEGKTNLLDAIYYLAFSKSAFQPTDSLNIKKGAPFFVVQGTFSLHDQEEKIHCGFKKGSRKQVKRGQKEYERLADHIGLLPAVMISPYDMNLVTGFSEDRRRFMDGVIAQYDRAYLESLLNYNRLLSQRNALLKHMAIEGVRKSETLDILGMQMESPAQHIYETRKAFLERLTGVFQDYYERLSGGKEQVSLTYQSHLHEKSQKEWLQEHTSRDLVLQHTGRGVHKDDLVFQLGEYAVKRMGSQGQQKTYLIALKLSQYALMAEIKKVKPILMIDDVFDKLDEYRVASLMKLIATEAFGQVFITDAHTGRLPAIFARHGVDADIYEVDKGAVKKPLTT